PERHPKATFGAHFTVRSSLRARTKGPAKSWTLRSVADAKRSATRNSSGASCYQAPSWLVDDNLYLGSASNAVKRNGQEHVVVLLGGPTVRTPVPQTPRLPHTLCWCTPTSKHFPR